MKVAIRFITLIVVLTVVTAPLYADDQDLAYPIRMPYRIVRGVTNIALGWTEIFLRPFGEHKTEPPLEAVSMGAAHGAIRTLVGWIDVTTFWVPDIQMLELYPDWQGWPYFFHWS